MGLAEEVAERVRQHEERILKGWLDALRDSASFRQELTGEEELRESCEAILAQLVDALHAMEANATMEEAWRPLREQLVVLTQAWVELGFSPAELAGFITLLRQPLVEALDGGTTEHLLDMISLINRLLDRLSLWAAEIFQRSQSDIIRRQQEELMELSTPVIKVWNGIVALPLIGTLDSSRTQVVMESLLTRIVAEQARVAILDITGVPTVDTLVAQHLLKAVTAARLMGAECIICGIRPNIAQTMVHLGIGLDEVTTRATLADAIAVALDSMGLRMVGKEVDS